MPKPEKDQQPQTPPAPESRAATDDDTARRLEALERAVKERDEFIMELKQSNDRLVDALSEKPAAPVVEEPQRDYVFEVVQDDGSRKKVVLPTNKFSSTKSRYVNGVYYEASPQSPIVLTLAEGTKIDRDLTPVLPTTRFEEPTPHFARLPKVHPHTSPLQDPLFGGTPTGKTEVAQVEGGESALARTADSLHSTTQVKV